MKHYAPPKDASAILDYEMDWSDWLETGVTIASATVTTDSEELSATNTAVEGGVVLWRLSGGTTGRSYTVVVQINTDNGQVDRRSIRVRVADR